MNRSTLSRFHQTTLPVPLALSRRRGDALHRQLCTQIKARILDGSLRPGMRLPSTREIAADLGLARATVTVAYDQLTSEGYLESRRGAGTYVCRELPDIARPQPTRRRAPHRPSSVRVSSYVERLGEWHPPAPAPPGVIDLSSREPDLSLFPFADWSRLLRHHLRRLPGRQMVSPDTIGGLPALREAIAGYLRHARAVQCDAAQIVVVNGSQQALDLCARVLLNPGDGVAVEDPGYPDARRLFAAGGAQVMPVPVDTDGLLVRALPPQARMAVVTPSHQYPLGMPLSLARRLDLLAWARRHHATILENDYDSEYRYEGSPLPALQGMPDASRVIYIGTFSLAMFPALRVGYLVLPPALVPAFLRVKWHADRQTPYLEQAALADFIRDGHLARHIRRMRRVYRYRRDVLLEALDRWFGSRATVIGASGGLHMLVRFSDRHVVARARARGVLLTNAAPCYAGTAPVNECMVRFSSVSDGDLVEGIRRLAGG